MNRINFLFLTLTLASGSIRAQQAGSTLEDAQLLTALAPYLRAKQELFAVRDTAALRTALSTDSVELNKLYYHAYVAYCSKTQSTPLATVPTVIRDRMRTELNWALRFHQYDTINEGLFKSLVSTKPATFLYLPYLLQAEETSTLPSAEFTSGPLGTAWGVNTSAIVDGIASWALQRAQEELMQAFLKSWVDQLSNDKYLRLMTPSTLTLIGNMEAGMPITQGDVWKAAFQKDLEACPAKLDSLVKLILRDRTKGMKDPDSLRFYDEVASAAFVFGNIYRGLAVRKDLEMVISSNALKLVDDGTPKLPFSGKVDYAIAQRALLGVSVLLDATRFVKNSKYVHLGPHELFAMNAGEFSEYWKYICVSYASRLKPALNIDDADMAKLALNSALVKAREQIMSVLESCEAIKRITGSDDTGSTVVLDEAAVTDYLELAMGLLDQGMHLSNGFKEDSKATRFIKGMGPQLLAHVMEVGNGVTSKQYGRVVNGVIDLTQLLVDSLDHGNDHLRDFMTRLNKYGGFMVDMLEAENGDEVKSALDKVTLGVGGYRVKQSSHFSGMISLYPGVFGGWERVYLQEGRTDGESRVDGALGAFLPIGVSLSAGTNCKSIPSIGVYLQIIDLGAALFYRLDAPENVSTVPAYTLDMLLSPGGYATFQIGRSPLTLGIGGNLSPRLRTVTDPSNLTFQASAMRYGFFLGVDVAALQLFASKKKYGAEIIRIN